MDTSVEGVMHVLGLVVGVSMGIPGIVANARNRAHLMPLTDKEATPLEELPVLTAAARAVGSFIRVPNQVSGLLQSLYGKNKNHNNAIRFGIMSFSSFFSGLVFFVTLWLMVTHLRGVTHPTMIHRWSAPRMRMSRINEQAWRKGSGRRRWSLPR